MGLIESALYFFATCTHLLQYRGDPSSVDDLDPLGGYFQSYPAIFFGYKETLSLEVRIEFTANPVVGLGNVVSRDGFFAGYLTNA